MSTHSVDIGSNPKTSFFTFCTSSSFENLKEYS
jgi:hypothetical protein